MNRRDALKALIASSGILAACRSGRASDQALMEEIADTLLPTTASSPGAKAAGAGAAMNLILSDCYTPADQQRVRDGLERFRNAHFLERSRAERETFVRSVGKEAWFEPVRTLALGAYFSSETGMTQALRYLRVPGKYVGCMPLAPGQPAWGSS
ncbi:MAG TPA: gluconate 2-dehydrogenase subunit 3 family protein [Steroidobacteraceae bacterium]